MTRRLHFILVLFFIVGSGFFLGCKQVNKSLANDCTLEELENIIIPTTTGIEAKYKICQIVRIDDQFHLLGYNRPAHQLDFWNLKERRYVRSLPFLQEGPDAISEVGSFYYHNADSIFILNRFGIFITNEQGKIIFSEKINRSNANIKGIDFSKQIIYEDIDHSSPLYFDQEEGCLYVPIKKTGHPTQTNDYYDANLCARLHLGSLSLEEIPISYPSEFKKEFYGLLDKPNLTFLHDKIIYNFKTSSNIYVYDKKSGETEIIRAPSAFTENQISAVSPNAMFDPVLLEEHINNNPRFLGVLFDPFHNVFYRPHYSALFQEANQAGEKRKEYLLGMDSSFSRFSEITIPPQMDFASMGVLPEGLLLYQEKETEDVAAFSVYQLQCPD